MSDRSARYRANLQGEIDSAALYRSMASGESRPQVAELYRRLAAVEESHAAFWRAQLEQTGAPAGQPRPGWRTRLLILAAKHLGPNIVLPTVRTLEQVDRDLYDNQPESRDTQLPTQERSHARMLSRLSGAARTGWEGSAYARLEGRHGAGGGNALRAAVLGANDGLVSNLSLVMGVAGAAMTHEAVLVAGLAGLVAGACSMSLGEWLSVQSSRELYQKQIATEKDELAQVPDEEREELVLIYESQGMSRDAAEKNAARVMANKDAALDTLVREEIGIDPQQLGGSAWTASVSSFVVFAVGAFFPVAPFLFLEGRAAVMASLALSAGALFASGALATVFTGRSALYSGLRQMGFGIAAASITYVLGTLLHVAVA